MGKENKLLPKLRFSEFQDNWRTEELDSYIKLLSGYAFKGDDISETNKGIRLLRGINITEGRIRHSKDIDRYYNKTVVGLEKYLLQEDDLVLGMDGSKVGKNVSLISKEDVGSLLIQRVARIRAKDSTDIRFIYLNIFSERFHKYVDKVNTSSGIPHISSKQIKEFSIGFPTLPEQQKIASFITDVDTKITKLTKKKDLLEQYKRGIMQKIFNQELRFKNDEGNEFPDWEEKKLGEVSVINKGVQLNAVFLTKNGSYPCISGGINPSGYTEDFNTEENTITISEGGNSCGYVNLFKTKFWCGGHCYAIQNLKNNTLNDFLFQLLKYNEIKIMRLRVGSGLPNIQKKDINNFKIKLPVTLKEQTKIANFLSDIDLKIDALNTNIENSKTFKKGLLQKMFV